MRILQTFLYRIPKDTNDGVAFDAVLQELNAIGYSADQIRFSLMDAGEGLRQVSSVARVLKCFPDLERFQGSFEQTWDQKHVVFLSNAETKLHERLAAPSTLTTGSSDAIDSAILSEILHGVPKRFPLWEVDVFFSGVELLNTAGLAAAAFRKRDHSLEITSPGIHFRSHWGSSKRRQNLSVLVSLPPPEAGVLSELPTAAKALLDKIGKPYHSTVSIAPPPEDQPRIDALMARGLEIAKRYQENPFAGRPDATLPCPLPVVAREHQLGVPLILRREAGIPSIKDLLKKEFERLDYRYKSNLSGQGQYSLRRRSAQNYILDLSVDASPWGGQIHSLFSVTMPFAKFTIPVRLPPHGRGYPINESLPELIKNTAFVVHLLEETLVMELAAVFGRAPKWFVTLKTET